MLWNKTAKLLHFPQILRRAFAWIDRQPNFYVRLVIIAGVLLTSLYSAYRAARVAKLILVFYNPLLLLVLGIIASVIFLTRPKLGMLVLVPSFILFTWDFGTGSGTYIGMPILLLCLLIGLWIFDLFARRRVFGLHHSPTLFPMAAFLVMALVSWGFGQLPWFDFSKHAPIRAQAGEIGIFFLSFATFLWVGHNLPDLDTLKKVVILFCGAALVLMIGEYYAPLWQLTRHFVHPSVQSGGMFWTWLAAIAFSQAALNRKLSIYWRLFFILTLASALYIGLIKYRSWTSGWLPGLVAIGVIAWLGFPKIRKPALIGMVLIGLVLSARIISAVMIGDNQYSMSTRLAAWQIIGQIVSKAPIFGLGPANYYWYTPLFSIMGYRVVFNSHNNYIDLIAQMGIVGITVFLWFSWAVLRVAYRLRDAIQGDFSRAYVFSILGGWVGSLVAGMLGDWVLPFVYNVGYTGLRASLLCWFFLGGLLYIERLHAGHKTPRPGELDL